MNYVLFSICYFYVWIVENIFSTHATVYGSHSAMFAFYWKREYFFFMCILNLIFFKNLVCVFLFIPTSFIFSQNCFSQNLFYFFYFYSGRNFFLTFVVLRESCFYSLLHCCVCFLSTFRLGSLCQYMTKRGRHRWPICFV